MDDQVGREVKRLREEKGWNQAKLAVEARMSVSGVSQIENGKRNLSTATLGKLAEALDVDVWDLFPKGQRPLPFEASSASAAAAGDPATWLEERAGHAHIALRSTKELEGMVTGPDADENMAMLREEYNAAYDAAGGMERVMVMHLDPAGKFMRAWAAHVRHKKRSGVSEEEIGKQTVKIAADLAALGAA